MASTTEELLDDPLSINNLRRALAALPPEQQTLFIRYVDGKEGHQTLSQELGIPLNALRLRVHRIRLKIRQNMAQMAENAPATASAEEPNPVSPVPDSAQPTHRQPLPLEYLRHLLQAHSPVLYARILEPTLADLRQEHSAALADERLLKARWILLRGCCALAAAAICQLGHTPLGRLATLWQTRSLK